MFIVTEIFSAIVGMLTSHPIRSEKMIKYRIEMEKQLFLERLEGKMYL